MPLCRGLNRIWRRKWANTQRVRFARGDNVLIERWFTAISGLSGARIDLRTHQ